MGEELKEKLKKKKLIISILGICVAAAAIIAMFLPIFEVTQTVETLGIEETISAKFSVFQVITQSEEIALKSTSVFGEFEGFDTIDMVDLLGGEQIAEIVRLFFIVSALIVFSFCVDVICMSLVNKAQDRMITGVTFGFFIFLMLTHIILMTSISEETTGFSHQPSIVIVVILAAAVILLTVVFKKLFSDVGEISVEILLTKYKNENSDEWYGMFIKDIAEYIDNSNFKITKAGDLRLSDEYKRCGSRKG